MRLIKEMMMPLSRKLESFGRIAIGCLLIAAGLGACSKSDKPAQVSDPPPQNSASQPPSVSVMGAKDQGVGMMEKIQEYRQRLDKDPKDLEALIFLGNANYDIQRYDKAVEYYERAVVLDPKNLHVRTDLATSYRNSGKVDDAVKEYKEVLAQDPKHETALYNLGFVLLNDKKDTKGALKVWNTLVSNDPANPKFGALRTWMQQIKKGSPSTG
jgi:tetratricopeptide (TPR) repeat protein